MEAIFGTRRPLDRARWQAIVIHHSGAPSGKPDSLDAQARAVGLKELGYHFVIGNGNGMANGELFVGRRWRDQAPGAHVGGANGDWYNQRAIGVCVVGDGDRGRLTEAQMERLTELTASLCRRLGIAPGRVYLHSDLAPTSSPGRLFPGSTFRDDLASRL
jgi:N-acetyl-anhydromuramyl-L-alanine amidase AmpD